MTRACCVCHAPIYNSSGFTLARDFLACMDAWERGGPLPSVRELCGKCAMAHLDDDEPALRRFIKTLEAIE